MARNYWTEAELDMLERWYPCMSTPLLARLLQRSERSIYAYASYIGVKKSAFYNAVEHGRQGERLRRIGAASRFKTGLTPWNKGTRYVAGGRSAETRFKKGSVAANYQPAGSLRFNADGYIDLKVKETGLRGWRAFHIELWEDENGPLPRSHILRFRDGDPLSIDLDNLECITRAENMRRNSYHRYPQPIPQLIQLRGALQRQINRREQREKQD